MAWFVTAAYISDIVEVHDRYLKVLDAPMGRPYLRPFLSRGTNVWFNDNVSGSYAPSNLKAAPGPFFKVANVAGNGLSTTYTLPADHAERASQNLLRGHKLPIAALTTFMYRDYGLHLAAPTIKSAIAVFRDEFCLRSDSDAEAGVFDAIFYDDTTDFVDADLELLQA